MLADKELAKNDTLLPQIAYYATLAADRVGDKYAIDVYKRQVQRNIRRIYYSM